jgi:hypothetical protein
MPASTNNTGFLTRQSGIRMTIETEGASLRVHTLWVRYPEACPPRRASFGLHGVAASVSEWMGNHSLTLAATRVGKRGEDMMGGLVKCLWACPEDLYL